MIPCLGLVDLLICYMFPLRASSQTPFFCARKCALSRHRHDRPGPLGLVEMLLNGSLEKVN